jgi:hypothetical protein
MVAPLIAAALPASASAAKFDVSLHARQLIEWKQDLTVHACGGGVFRTLGDGDSLLVAHSRAPVRVTARREGREVRLVLPGGGPPVLPVAGRLTRNGTDSGITLHPGRPGACRPPEPIPVDCGTRTLPAGSRVSVMLAGDRIALAGPLSTAWEAGPGFRHCLSMGRDDLLAGPATGTREISVRLPVRKLFGKRRRFAIRGVRTETVDHMAGLNTATLRGTRPTVTTTDWKLTFVRKGRR